MVPFIRKCRKRKPVGTESRSVGLAWGVVVVPWGGDGQKCGAGGKVLQVTSVMVEQLWEYMSNPWIECFKWVGRMVYGFHLRKAVSKPMEGRRCLSQYWDCGWCTQSWRIVTSQKSSLGNNCPWATLLSPLNMGICGWATSALSVAVWRLISEC